MDLNTLLKEIDTWPVEDRLKLVQEVWDRLADSGWQPELTEEQKAELDRRLERHEANPNESVGWDEIVARVKRKR